MNMRLPTQLFTFASFVLFVCITAEDIPDCTFEDTVNITASEKFANGSYLHEGVLIPPSLIGTYDYDITYRDHRFDVPLHIRGCICKLKTCIKFCCHPRELRYYSESNIANTLECTGQVSKELEYNPLVNVTFKDGTERTMHAVDEFVVQQGVPCNDAYPLRPQLDDADDWTLFENGTLLRLYDMLYMSKQEYCFSPHNLSDIFVLNPFNCPWYPVVEFSDTLNKIVMSISIPFLVITFLVYAMIPVLRNLHGKCFSCYLLCLAIGYSCLTISTIDTDVSETTCFVLGYMTYFALFAAFMWLSVISFDLWHNFSGSYGNTHNLTQKTLFRVYSCYAWGLTIVFTAVTMSIQFYVNPSDWVPSMGVNYCWFPPDTWTAMIYFYDFVLIVILFDTIMFVLTSMKIYKAKRDLERMLSQEDGMVRHYRSQKDNYGLFLRLFVIMGVTWLLEILAYVLGSQRMWKIAFYLPDLLNASMGLIIFVLFVAKKKVIKLIQKRLCPGRVKEDESLTRSSRLKSSASHRSKLSSSGISLTTKTLVH